MKWWVTGRYNLDVKIWTLLSYTDLNCFPSVYRDSEGGWDWSSVLHRTVQEETSAQLGSVWKLLLLGRRGRTVAGSTEPTGSEEIPLKSSAASVGCLPWAAAASRYLLKLVTWLFIIVISSTKYILGTTEVSSVCIVGQICFQMNCKIINSVTMDFSSLSWYFCGMPVMSSCLGSSACAGAPCHLCQLTKRNSVGFSCSCEKSKVLLLDGKCECQFHLLVTNVVFQFSLDKLIKNFYLDLSDPDFFRVWGEM